MSPSGNHKSKDEPEGTDDSCVDRARGHRQFPDVGGLRSQRRSCSISQPDSPRQSRPAGESGTSSVAASGANSGAGDIRRARSGVWSSNGMKSGPGSERF